MLNCFYLQQLLRVQTFNGVRLQSCHSSLFDSNYALFFILSNKLVSDMWRHLNFSCCWQQNRSNTPHVERKKICQNFFCEGELRLLIAVSFSGTFIKSRPTRLKLKISMWSSANIRFKFIRPCWHLCVTDKSNFV